MTSSEYIYPVEEENFHRLVVEKSYQVPVLVDFWADWCAPCHMLMPILSKLAEEYGGQFLLAKVNTDEQRQLAMEHGIRSLPTVRLFRHGAVVEEFFGVQPEEAIRALLDAHVERESDQVRVQAMEAQARGNTAEAVAMLRQALDSDPGNERINLDLASLLIEQGQFDEAERVLKSLPSNRQLDPDVSRLFATMSFGRIAQEAPPAETLETQIHEDPKNCEARYQLSAIKTLAGDYQGAMDQLLEILRRDRSFRDDAGRKGLIAIFELLGEDNPLVNRYRGLMSKALY